VTNALEMFIGSARWFGGKGRGFTVGDIRRFAWLGQGEDEVRTRIELVSIEYDDGSTERYQVPLAYYAEPQERLDHAFVGEWRDDDLGPVFVYDALQDWRATALWLRSFARRQSDDVLVFHRIEGHDLDLEAHSALFPGEQSNSSVRFGEDSLMKVFRKVTPGRNPDIEIHDALTTAGNEHVAALYGWLEAPARDGDEPLQLAMLQQYLRTASDGWGLALASVRDLFSEADLHADEVGGDFAGESHRLGVATAQVHDALADRFPTELWAANELRELCAAMKGRLDRAAEIVPELREHAHTLRVVFDAITKISAAVVVQRVHGDFHLGQTLRTVRGWKIVDFEGEPAKPLAERVLPDSGWRDVAGMLRSLDYAAHAVEVDVDADAEEARQIAYRALEWVDRNRSAFLEGYVGASDRTQGGTLSEDQRVLLRAYEVDKAVYETAYEARNRPSWLTIPLSAIERLTRSGTDPQEGSNP